MPLPLAEFLTFLFAPSYHSKEDADIKGLIQDLTIAEGFLVGLEALFNAVPECGGVFTGDACAGTVLGIKIALAVGIATLSVCTIRICFLITSHCLGSNAAFLNCLSLLLSLANKLTTLMMKWIKALQVQ